MQRLLSQKWEKMKEGDEKEQTVRREKRGGCRKGYPARVYDGEVIIDPRA